MSGRSSITQSHYEEEECCERHFDTYRRRWTDSWPRPGAPGAAISVPAELKMEAGVLFFGSGCGHRAPRAWVGTRQSSRLPCHRRQRSQRTPGWKDNMGSSRKSGSRAACSRLSLTERENRLQTSALGQFPGARVDRMERLRTFDENPEKSATLRKSCL